MIAGSDLDPGGRVSVGQLSPFSLQGPPPTVPRPIPTDLASSCHQAQQTWGAPESKDTGRTQWHKTLPPLQDPEQEGSTYPGAWERVGVLPLPIPRVYLEESLLPGVGLQRCVPGVGWGEVRWRNGGLRPI